MPPKRKRGEREDGVAKSRRIDPEPKTLEQCLLELKEKDKELKEKDTELKEKDKALELLKEKDELKRWKRCDENWKKQNNVFTNVPAKQGIQRWYMASHALRLNQK